MIIQSSQVFIAGQFVPAQIKINKGIIVGLAHYGENTPDVDYEDKLIVPGFIDVHTHGMLGYSADEPAPEGLIKWAQSLPEEGVTSFLPTTTSQTKEVTLAALENIHKVRESNPVGAQILGVHLEGPFLDQKYRGMHTSDWLRNPTLEEFQAYENVAESLVKYITMACEHDNDYALIRYASERGVTVSIGHTGTSFEGAMLGLANGAKGFTHSFNAMKALHHREPGVVGAVMSSNAFAEIIADGHHVHPTVIKILFNAKNMVNLILVTDAIGVKGLPEGVYEVSNTKVSLDQSGTARNYGTDTIAGSSLRMIDGVRLLVEKAAVPMEDAVLAATLNPARVLKIEEQKGQIRYGNDADLVVLDDFKVYATYCNGEIRYKVQG